MKNYPAGDIWSHPHIPLSKHLYETIVNITNIITDAKMPEINVGALDIPAETIKIITKLVGGLHDLGKSTSFFQKYIRSTNDYKKMRKLKADQRTNHAKIGALYAFYTIIDTEVITLGRYSRYLVALAVYIAISRHHGNLKSLRDERNNLKEIIYHLEESDYFMREQFTSIDSRKISTILDFLSDHIGLKLPQWTEFLASMTCGKLRSDIKGVGRSLNGLEGICDGNYKRKFADKVLDIAQLIGFLVQFLYSLLQDADKTSAMRRSTIQRLEINLNHTLTQYYESVFTTEIKGIQTPANPLTLKNARASIFRETDDYARSFPLDQRIHTLEAPTGSGKTLANARWVFTLKQRLQAATGKNYRIIYLLPFLSIIEQTYTTFLNIFKFDQKKPQSNLLLKHHYLTEIAFKLEDQLDEFSPNESLFFVEGWNSEIVISTFHQFFHSLLTNRKSQLRKFNKFTNSIFVLDEIQAVPAKYWEILNSLLPRMLEFGNSYLLFSTATMPGIFRSLPPSVSITGKLMFSHLNRTIIQYLELPISVEKLIPELKNSGQLSNHDNFLFVLNTKKSADFIFQQLKNDPEFQTSTIFYLSANLLPVERKKRLDKIQGALKQSRQVILVSTQVIEAGVDLSFNQGFRDLAPFDSIIQTIGRINRHGSSERPATVTVAALIDKHKQKLSSYIYDILLLRATEKILQETSPLPEMKFRDVIRDYFDEVKRVISAQPGKLLSNLYCQGEFTEINNLFKLIPEQGFRVPVYVSLNQEAQDIWTEYLNLEHIKDWKKRNSQYIRIKPRLYQYIVNVNKDLVNTTDFTDHGWVYHLNDLLVHRYYDSERGFVGLQSTPSHYIL